MSGRGHGRGRAAPWAEHALERMREAGYRKGGARRAVIDVLARETCALSALEIDARLDAVGRASVYRTLAELAELGLVHKLDLGAETGRYERTEPGGEHHHHMVCDNCGRVLPFEDPALERAVSAFSGQAGFEVRDHEVVLHGACAACR